MSLSEFQLIEKYFRAPSASHPDVLIGIGDDGALVKLPTGVKRVGVFETVTANSPNINTDHPRAVGHRVLSTALNKLAAIGAAPAWMTLSLTLPDASESWLEPFSEGLLALATRYDVSLIGGDTTRGPLTVTVMLDGYLPAGSPSQRAPGPEDLVYVSGLLGAVASALIATSTPHLFSDRERRQALLGLEFPEPRVALGNTLRELAIATADLSGGLTHGIETLLGASELGAQVKLDRVPISAAVRNQTALAPAYRPWLTLSGDHELIFSLPPSRRAELLKKLELLDVTATMIGNVDNQPAVRFIERE